MNRLPSLITCCFLAIVLAANGPLSAQPAVDLGSIVERHEMIPMRDGRRLSVYLYVPPGEGKWPALFEQRYADIRGASTRKAAAKLAEAGYVVALVNFRGTHESEATWVGYRALGWGDLQDGYDTCEWLAQQPWCTGKVGTFGSSQGGFAQNFLAVTRPPHLVCQYMVDTGLSLFQEGYRIGGVTRPERFQRMESFCRQPADNRRLVEEWFRHPDYDDYWRQEDCSLHFDKMNVPCFTIGSWYDFMNQGSIASFLGRQHQGGPGSRGRQQLLLGPWLHGRLNKTSRVGEMTYPANATWPEYEHMVRWFDHWLKGRDTGVEREPAVRYYVMGAMGEQDAPGNVWRTADDWPPSSQPTALYLQAGGGLAADGPELAEGATSYISDPLAPMQIPGTGFPGARDARPFEKQAEVRTFTTEPLDEPMEWTGRIRAELFVSSTARDTDFLVRISDVYPDGRSILICDYPRRARYREGFDHQALLEPGKVYPLAFDVGWISQIFNRGHRIRVTIASTGAPLYEPNPQTGGPQTIEFPANPVKAVNSIHHSRLHASRILAPVAVLQPAAAAASQYIEPNRATGSSRAVVVNDVPLIHTAQLLPPDEAGKIASPGDAAAQFDRVLSRVKVAIGGKLDPVVKLNVYMAREDLAEVIHRGLAKAFGGDRAPAVSFVVTPLPKAAALVAVDAVATPPASTAPKAAPVGQTAVLDAGSRIYISGQAEKADSLREATRKTLASLSATLKFCGRADDDFVALKCFFQPMSKADEVRDEIERYFERRAENSPKGRAQPVVSLVEWRAAAPPIEIEAIAWGGPARSEAAEPIEFLTPPGMTASPVYSRVARIHRGGTIFIGDLFGKSGQAAEEQIAVPFEELRTLLDKTGSDFRHLAKATYYVTDDDASKAHNALRPKYYDPKRPPAASKAIVAGTGHPDARYSMDMIAVPTPSEPKSK